MSADVAAPSRLHDLIALARETDSGRRRELLRGVTDLFFSGERHGATEMALFDEVLGQLAGQPGQRRQGEQVISEADDKEAQGPGQGGPDQLVLVRSQIRKAP